MNNQAEAEKRLRILIFWEKHGDEAAKEAFRVSRRTLYRWQEALRREAGKLQGLDKRSTAPKKRNVRRIPAELEAKLIAFRKSHHRLGKKKLAVLLKTAGFPVSVSYAGRCLGDLKRRGLLPKYGRVSLYARTGRIHEQKRVYKPKIRRSKQNKRGLEIDTVVRFVGSTKRYIYTAIDLERRFAFGGAYTRHSSETATDFLEKLIHVAPFTITEIQTDNGSEFAHLFHDACTKLGIRHYHTYPRCPKMNGTVERFNRTLSEDFIQHHLPLLRDDILQFNERMIDWLLWYNAERPHESLGMLSPLQYYVKTLPVEECQMWWTRT
ncbi:MAG: integrase core domain-containing protein, partial [bacterium]|nr:integrase core domain-containing protein [bacterium]